MELGGLSADSRGAISGLGCAGVRHPVVKPVSHSVRPLFDALSARRENVGRVPVSPGALPEEDAARFTGVLGHGFVAGAGDCVTVRGCQRRPHFVITDTKNAATNTHTMAHATHPNANPKTTAGTMTNARAAIRNAATGCLRFQSGTPASSSPLVTA